jgi:hypothetical protein
MHRRTSRRCRICEARAVETILQLGQQPVSSHFTTTPGAPVATRDLALGVCTGCGVVQLLDPFPFDLLVPRFDWITPREPEDHLDAVSERIINLPSVTRNACVLGLSIKDRTTLARLSQHGFTNTRLLDPGMDLGADHPHANIESVQALLTPATANHIVATYGHSDVLIARHVLEHAEETRRFMFALNTLLSPGGHLVIEVPDCTANLRRMDYTMIWEEHVTYFTADTLPQVLAPLGLECLAVEVHAYPFEDVLVMYVRKPASAQAAPANTDALHDVMRSVELSRRYAAGFVGWTERYRSLFDALTTDGRKIAAYGAGHLTCAFLNFHRLAEYFAFVVDDVPQKQGLFLPGNGCRIVAHERLCVGTAGICLFGLAPQIEDRAIANASPYCSAGGEFFSMFANSPRSIRQLLRSSPTQIGPATLPPDFV